MKNGGPLSEREARGFKGGLRTLIDEADLDQGRLRLGMERKRDFRGRRTDMTTVRTDFPDVGDDLEDIIEAGRVDDHPSVRKKDKRGRWAKARRVIMGMGRVELLVLAAESCPVDGQTPITDGIGRLVARLLPRERMVIWEFAKTILQIGVGPGAFSGEELETELYYQGLGEECPSGDEKETEMRNIEESRARKVTPIKTGGRYSYRKHLSVEQEEELSMKNAIHAYRDDHQALDDIAAEAWKRLYLEPVGARRDQNRKVTEVIFAEARRKLAILTDKEAETGICVLQNEWGTRVLGTYAIVDWLDCLNSPAPEVSVAHVGDPSVLSPCGAGDELDEACQSTMDLAERQIWEDVERVISSN